MAFIRTRLKHLESRQRRQHPAGEHFITCVQVPWGEDRKDYLAHLPCPCGTKDCTQKRIGLLVSRRCQTVEEWQSRDAAFAAKRHEPPLNLPNTDLHVILNGVEGRPDDAA
jgi:hypothetical protein